MDPRIKSEDDKAEATMKITSFNFGGTPLYVVDGVVAEGIVYARQNKSVPHTLSATIFFVSGALLLYTLVATSGRSYAVRAGYALRTGVHAVTQTLRGQHDIAAIGGVLPLADALTNAESVTPTSGKIDTLSIPKLRLSIPVVEPGSTELLAVTAALQEGVVRWPGSAPLGEDGTAILLGHSSAPLSYHGSYGSVFALLDKLAAGDVVIVHTSGGDLMYRVRGRTLIDPKKYTPAFLGSEGGEMLVLVSCWPVGTAWQRIAVRAERVD